MDKIKTAVELSEEQYQELKTNGTLTIGDLTLTFDENVIYVTPDATSEQIVALNTKVDSILDELAALNESLKTILGV